MKAIIGLAIAIAWILLPFAMFGTKPLLKELIGEVRQTNKLLARIADQSARSAIDGPRN